MFRSSHEGRKGGCGNCGQVMWLINYKCLHFKVIFKHQLRIISFFQVFEFNN